jgi:hypothetical protein
MGTLFEIKYTGMKRKGLVAKERIRRDTRITAEKPLLQFHSHTPPRIGHFLGDKTSFSRRSQRVLRL